MLRGRWLLIVSSVIVCVAIAAALAWTKAPVYTATTQLFVSSNGSSADPGAAYQGGLFSQQRVLSYAQVISSPALLDAVIKELRLNQDSQQLAEKIQTAVPTNTVLLNVTVQDGSARSAQVIADALAGQFVGFVKRLEAPPGGGASPVKVTITKPARLPTSPTSPRKPAYLAIGLVLGLLLGIGVAVGLEAFDRRIRSDDDVFAATGVAVLGMVSERSSAKPKVPIVLTEPFSDRTEAYRRLGLNLGVLIEDRGLRSFMISSVTSDEGQAVVAANLGIVLAKAGYRTVLVDANLQRPRLTAILGIAAPVGLADVVRDGVPLESALQTWSVGVLLTVIGTGSERASPSDVLASARFSVVVEELHRQFDVVIVTSPPLLKASDATAVARQTSAAILVARGRSTRFDDLAAAADSLHAIHAALLGVVVNGRTRHRGGGSITKRDGQARSAVVAPPTDGARA